MLGKWDVAVAGTAAREMRLKTLVKSSLTSTLPGEDWLRQVQARAVWTAIPTPAFTPTRVRASSFTICIKHFAMSRRKTSPMAMGRAPSPWHCDQASPGQNRSNGSAGTTLNQHQGDQPRQMFQCTVGHARGPASRRCWTQRPEGPLPESYTKLAPHLPEFHQPMEEMRGAR